jgi:hypothetical protein
LHKETVESYFEESGGTMFSYHISCFVISLCNTL